MAATLEQRLPIDGSSVDWWAALTPAEERIVRLVAQGWTYREIAEQLWVSRRTVETHVANVFLKVGVGSRHALLRAWLDRPRTAARRAGRPCPSCGRA